MSRLGRTLLTLTAVAIVAAAVSPTFAVHRFGGQGQQQPPVFRSGVQVVEVDARVFDGDGRFVTTLTRADFEILEDGVLQPIVAMTLVDGGGGERTIPTVPTAPPPTITTSATPTHVPTTPRHTWIFFFDLNHLTPGGGFDRARKAVEEFIGTRFTEGDLAGVIAGDKMVNNRLTSLRAELMQAVRSVKPRGDQRTRMLDLTREWPRFRGIEEAMEVARENRDILERVYRRACAEVPQECAPPVDARLVIREKARRLGGDFQRATQQTLATLNGIAAGLARMQGPKTVVFLSDGFAVKDLETSLRTVVGQTARAGARVYSIDVRGLSRGMNSASIDALGAEAPDSAPPEFDGQEDGVNSLAVDTGGMMIRNENNIGRALDLIASDTNRYYVLGYQPTNTNFDGKYRKIEIRVKRPGLKVRARQGYLALEPSKMLVPQPIKQTEPTPVATAPPAGAVTDAAVIATPPPAPPAVAIGEAPSKLAEGLGIRPNHLERIGELSKGAAAGTDEASRGWSAYQRGEIETALPLLERAASRADARPWVNYALGFAYIGVGRPRDAIAAWERVRHEAADFQPVLMDLAATYAQMSDLTQALAVLRDAAARWPSDPDIHNGIGVLLIRRNALDDAINAFTKATTIAPADALSWLNLGRAYELRYDRARRYDEQLLRWVGPEGDRTKAAQSYERCVRLGGPYAGSAAAALARMNWSE